VPDSLTVVKVGGSLFDLPDLASRLMDWLHDQGPVLLVPGGGAMADAVRSLDRQHRLGEEAAHWLALRAMSLNAHILASLLPSATVVRSVEESWPRIQAGQIPVLNAHAFAAADERRPGSLPHSWAVTSDSLAARVAVVAGARRLFLLKSADIPPTVSWTEAGRRGWVDAFFAEIARRAPGMEIRTINLRGPAPAP
jgi:aspartokinase-like uncharacterized kinase